MIDASGDGIAGIGGAQISVITANQNILTRAVCAEIVRARITIIAINFRVFTRAGIAGIGRAGVAVITILGNILTASIYTKIIRAGVTVIQNAKRLEVAGSIDASVIGARAEIITDSLYVHTLTVQAVIVGA